MNFLFILNTFYPNIGGVENATFEICKRLKKRGHNVYVLTTTKTNFYPNNKKLTYSEKIDGIQIVRVQYFLRIIDIPLRALYLAKKFQIDYVFITDFWGFIAIFLKKMFRIPFVYVLNGYNPICPRGILFHTQICRGFEVIKCIKQCRQFSVRFIITVIITRLLLREAKTSIAISKAVRNAFISFFGKLPLKVMYYGIDSQKFQPLKIPSLLRQYNLTNSDKIILFFGRLIKERAVLEFLPHFSTLTKQIDCKLVIVGLGPKISEIKSKVTELSLEGKVIFTGILRNQRLVNIINLAHVVILPILFPEPYPLVILEAMACGKAIVSFDLGGVKESLDDMKTGLLIPPNDWTHFTNKVHQLLRNEELRKSIGLAARRKVERNSNWSKFMDEFLKDIN